MDIPKLRIVLLTHGGAEKVLAKLCSLDCAAMVGVIIESKKPPTRSLFEKIQRSIRYDGYPGTIIKLYRSAFAGKSAKSFERQDRSEHPGALRELSEFKGVPVYEVSDYHDADSISLLRSLNPDLAVVFGTNILKESVFKIPRLGSINFHSGVVPLYRGGPPVFWELFNNEKEVGLTVHWVASKVDAGEVIRQESVPLAYDYSYGSDFESFIEDYRMNLADRCAEMLAESVRSIANGVDSRQAQDLSIGKRYRLPTKREKEELRRRLKQRRHADQVGKKRLNETSYS